MQDFSQPNEAPDGLLIGASCLLVLLSFKGKLALIWMAAGQLRLVPTGHCECVISLHDSSSLMLKEPGSPFERQVPLYAGGWGVGNRKDSTSFQCLTANWTSSAHSKKDCAATGPEAGTGNFRCEFIKLYDGTAAYGVPVKFQCAWVVPVSWAD